MKLSMTRRAIALLCIVSLVMLPIQQALAATITKEYYHYNHQGSPIGVYDGKGNELLIQRWTPWGGRQVLKTSAPGTSTGALLKHGLPAHMGYTGHKDLVAAGLVFMGDTRLYSPELKRFLNPDDRTTGGIRGENRSAYAYNNPIRFIDPDGHRAAHVESMADLADIAHAQLVQAQVEEAERFIRVMHCCASPFYVAMFVGGVWATYELGKGVYKSINALYRWENSVIYDTAVPEASNIHYPGADHLDDRNTNNDYSHAHTSPLEEEKKALESPTTGGPDEL